MNEKTRTVRNSVLRSGLAVAPLTLGLLACGAASEPQSEPFPLTSLSRDVSLGAEGADVRAVNEYLRRFGYFPNDTLARDYPNWRPIVEQGPADNNVFDDQTAEGIRRLQANTGIPVTGIVDEPTRDLLQRARCGVPDGIVPPDPLDKFAFEGGSFYPAGSIVSYKVTNGSASGVTQAQMQATADTAFQTWANEISLNSPSETIGLVFVPTTGSAKITISFGNTDGALGSTSPTVPSTVVMDTSRVWSLNNNAGSSNYNLLGVLTHELGHALGLHHSSVSIPLSPSTSHKATMFPSVNPQESFTTISLDVDDKVAISARYDVYSRMSPSPSGVRDISVGANGTIWVVGSVPANDGFAISRFNGQEWQDSLEGAKRIAVGTNGTPWIIKPSGTTFHGITNDPETDWAMMPGTAADIAVGYNGMVWKIDGSCGTGDCQIFRFHETSPVTGDWEPDLSHGAAVRIAVGHKGVPWVLNSAKRFYRYTTNDPRTGSWQQMPGLSDDLAIGPGNRTQGNSAPLEIDYVWSIGRLSNGMVSLAVWDEQAPLNSGSPPPFNPFAWVGGGRPCSFDATSAVAVGPRGEPYVACNGGSIITPVK